MKLSDVFTPGPCKALKAAYNIDTVEQAASLSDDQLLQCRGIGLRFIDRLRRLTATPNILSIRDWYRKNYEGKWSNFHRLPVIEQADICLSYGGYVYLNKSTGTHERQSKQQ